MGQGSSISRIGNDFELAIKASKELEELLIDVGADGGGLNEKISEVNDRNLLDPNCIRDIRYIAYIRNKLIHEVGYDEIPNREKFIERYERTVVNIEEILVDGDEGSAFPLSNILRVCMPCI